MSLQIEATDVVRILLQFCKENNLRNSFAAIEEECQITLNTVDSIDAFVSDINNGRWDAVLSQVARLQLPQKKLQDLYEQVILEMTEAKELDVARSLLRQTEAMQLLRQEDEKRYLRLENVMGRIQVDASDLYPGTSKQRKRDGIAKDLAAEVSIIPPSRLMTLIGQALKWQRMQGALPEGTAIDLLRGVAVGKVAEDERFPSALAREIKFGKGCHVECAAFSPDGLVVVTGTVDGFLEVWETTSGKMKMDLTYQAVERFMCHDSPILSVAFSRDGELLCSGDQKGRIKVWRYSSGQCLRQFPGAHSHGVTSVVFSRDGGQVLSASFDASVRIHGLKSGRILREFQGHGSYVNHAVFLGGGQRVASASSDGTVKIWDNKTANCVKTLQPPQKHAGEEAAVLSVHAYPKNIDYLVVCNRSSSVFLMTREGHVLRTFDMVDKESKEDFVACIVSPRGGYVYCLAANMKMYCFDAETGRMVDAYAVADKGCIGLTHHPMQNLVATYGEDCKLKFWHPS